MRVFFPYYVHNVIIDVYSQCPYLVMNSTLKKLPISTLFLHKLTAIIILVTIDSALYINWDQNG